MQSHRLLRIAGAGLAAALLAGLPLTASAHEGREVADGQYELTVGFLDEPAFVGLKNGLDLAVMRTAPAAGSPAAGDGEDGHDDANAVDGLSGSLQAQVIYGGETMDLELEPAFGEPGHYQSIFFPMAEGDYQFRIFGEIEGNAIDETFESGPETFSPVESPEPYQFPKGEARAADGVGAAATGGGAGGDEGGRGGPGGGLLAGVAGLAGAAVWLNRRRGQAPVTPARA